MEIGILGLSRCGKTTLFRALTGLGEAHDGGGVGVVKVPDPRLEALVPIFKPKKVVPAEVRYLDPGPAPMGREEGLGRKLLPSVRGSDVLLLVVRTFQNPRVPHPEGSVDAARDFANLMLELTLADLSLVERRLQRLEASLKAARPAERQASLQESSILTRIKEGLEGDVPVFKQGLTEEEEKALANYQLFTSKPLLVVLNIGEEGVGEAASLEAEWRARYGSPQLEVAALCAQLEMELGQLSTAEAEEFRSALGLEGEGRERIIKLSYDLLGLVTFFTVVSEEIRAWTIPEGTTAQRAAGKIHSDMERGFIRAEVIGEEDLVKYGSLAEAHRQGLVRLEGKGYQVRDGDVLTILFNV